MIIASENTLDHNIRTELDADGVLLATIEMPGRSMNVFSLDMMDSLERLIVHVEAQQDIRAVVLTSGKAAFLAGADLDMIRMFTERAQTDTHAQLVDLCGRLGRLFRRLEKSAKPYVAAINGLALGGGLEVSLACHGRVVADEAKLQLGLPEIKLGLLPGAGGTQRLPRMVGAKLGLRTLLDGNPLSPVQAIETGIVDEVVAPQKLVAAAKRRALALAGAAGKPWDQPQPTFDSAPFDFSRDDAVRQIAGALHLDDDKLRHYPAYRAIMDCVIGGWHKPMDAALEWEMECFVRLIQNPVAGNMVRTLFLNRQRAAKAAPEIVVANQALLAPLQAAQSAARAAGANEEEEVLAVAIAAAQAWSAGQVPDVELADVAVVQAGLHPAYTGGPFTYLSQTAIEALRARAAEAAKKMPAVFLLPAKIDALSRDGHRLGVEAGMRNAQRLMA